MHSKPTHKILYHCPQDVINLLVTMAEYYGKSRTAIITDGIRLMWDEYVQEINETLPIETGAEDVSQR